ncbi:heterokaryon incompatibility protein-domain-containing protein [Xylaria curta]|nr:heterokaryon incompatibility protein-domain-containing protein [Xylaria curta]
MSVKYADKDLWRCCQCDGFCAAGLCGGFCSIALHPVCICCQHKPCIDCTYTPPSWIWIRKNVASTFPPIHRAERVPVGNSQTKLCSICAQIKQNMNLWATAHTRGLIQSARDGCALCAVTQWIIFESNETIKFSVQLEIDRRRSRIGFKVDKSPIVWYDCIDLSLWAHSPGNDSLPRTASSNIFVSAAGVSATDSSLREWGFVEPLRAFTGSVDSERSYSIVKSWLSECTNPWKHPDCNRHLDSRKLPKRLLRINGPKLYLCDSDDLPMARGGSEYAILSYRWGEEGNLMTTRESEPQHRLGIDIDSLPATLKDSVQVATKLGFSFIWIDSLCIIQDLLGDWETEAPKMGQYYRYSGTIISALDASAATEGFLNSRRHLEVISTGMFGGNLQFRPSPPDRNTVFGKAELSQRGWALQERILSTRIVHYARNEIFWECHHCLAREGSITTETSPFSDPSSGISIARLFLASPQPSLRPQQGIYMAWYRLIEDYSRREFSRPTDRLPAILSLISTIQEQTGSYHTHGIFTDDLAGLLWDYSAYWDMSS